MRFDKLQNQLDILLMLTENRQYTIADMMSILNMSQRNIYYYLEFFKHSDFEVSRRGEYYSISRESKFISKLCDIVKFTEDEAITMRRLLASANGNDIMIRKLRTKFDRFFDFDIIENTPVRLHQTEILRGVYQAIKERKQLCIHGYSSTHSQSVKDRIVEPFLLMNGSNDVRAYELSSDMNKTFKLARMESVEILDTDWQNRSKHRTMFNDFFNFSSEELIHVTLKLDMLSRSILLEEYPMAERDLKGDILDTNVCSMLGIGRFVLGLYDHIEVIDSPELTKYLQEKLRDFRRLDRNRKKSKEEEAMKEELLKSLSEAADKLQNADSIDKTK